MSTSNFIWPNHSGKQCIYSISATAGIGAGKIVKDNETKKTIEQGPLCDTNRLREDNN